MYKKHGIAERAREKLEMLRKRENRRKAFPALDFASRKHSYLLLFFPFPFRQDELLADPQEAVFEPPFEVITLALQFWLESS